MQAVAQRSGKLLRTGVILGSHPELGGCSEGDGRKGHLQASVGTGGNAAAVIEAAEHDLESIAAFVAALADRLVASASRRLT